MKVITDFSVSSRPLRVGAGFTPRSLFAQGAGGVYWSAAQPDRVFADTPASAPGLFGHSVARVNDLSPNERNAVQASAALRPLLGRAPVDAPPGGAIDQGSGPAFIRFDLADDVLPITFPDGGTFDVMVFGRKGSWIARDVEIAAEGSLNIGPTTITGGPAGLLTALGDIVGWTAVDRTLTEAEVNRLVQFHKARGAKGLLVPGAELLPNPGDPFTTLDDWQNSADRAVLSLVDGAVRAQRDAGAQARVGQNYSAVDGGVYFATAEIDHVSGADSTVFSFAGGIGTSTSNIETARANAARGLVFVNPFGAGSRVARVQFPDDLSTVDIRRISVRELRPQEDW